jgi:hypothetical protein
MSDEEEAKAIKLRRMARKRTRDELAAEGRIEHTKRMKKEVLARLAATDDPVLVETIDLTGEALEFFRSHFNVTPHFADDDDDFHSLWRID